ncbi:hypothetical protein SAMN04487846_0125 [Microbacterium sp. cf046]|uniref:DUF2255 family protein n=1 Tax=Microbacterium sp. cf046 TaxID=1761803 RepID=UPI0008E064C9|nr:DUF2255 family protein [Microbacterium sp. cf046]SFR87072.1 hypothetical protein SAMN04487846_0125 [Microbacterium sp. cf046]
MTEHASVEHWTPEDLRHLDGALELEIAAPRDDCGRGRWTPIWVVVVDDDVFVRTWRRRDTGWYGRSLHAERAWIRVAGRSVDVTVAFVGDGGADAVDAAYQTKYGAMAARSMVTAEAAASTLRLSRAST